MRARRHCRASGCCASRAILQPYAGLEQQNGLQAAHVSQYGAGQQRSFAAKCAASLQSSKIFKASTLS
eukprot:6214356-Pleurochrysis_carterae.AAC.3